ncbi:MAG: hypothetical protein GYB65_22830, partial [Chloroflexi bacterium]|nr:hypothetical protein [Chloroflexota bacterium]
MCIRDSDEPARRPITIWRAVGFVGAMIAAFWLLTFFTANLLVLVIFTPLVALVIYQVWYLAVERTAQ